MSTKSCLAIIGLLAIAAGDDGYAIINGQIDALETAVGVVVDETGNPGSAVLIEPYRVLTSAAFASACTNGHFHVGSDYRTPDAVHAVSGVYPHPDFDPDTGEHNIALLHLAAPVVGITPIPYAGSPSAVSPGALVRFVGHGWSSLYEDSNTLRRACSSTIDVCDAVTFITFDAANGPYWGQGSETILNGPPIH